MKINYRLICINIFLLLFFFITFANASEVKTGITNPIKVDGLTGLIRIVLSDIVSPVLTILAVLFLMYSGFLFVSAQGNEQQLTKAKEVLKWTLIGLFVLISANVFAEIIQNTAKRLQE